MKSKHLCAGLLVNSLLWLAPQALAASFTLDATGGEPLYQSPLPLEVYQYTRQDDLSDITISNGAGERVPHALLAKSLVHPPAAAINTSIKLPIFPLQASALSYTTSSGVNDLRLKLEKSTNRTTVSITEGGANTDTTLVFLLDAGEKHPSIQKLTLDWAETDGKLIEVEVLASDDLNSWTTIGNAVLLKTSNAFGAILQNTVTLSNPGRARYLQLRTVNMTQAFNLTGAEAQMSTQATEVPKLLWQNLSLANPQSKRTEDSKTGQTNIEFEAAGHYPAEFLRVNLPEDNTITTVKISVRNKTTEPWRYITTASAYRLVQKNAAQQNTTLSSPDITIYPTVARYWRLQFNAATGGIGASNPGLSLGWPTQTIVWNARGNSPFTMQTGESETTNHVTIESLIPDFKVKKLQQLPLAVIKLKAAPLPGDVSADAHGKVPESTWSSPEDNKRWWLWGGLVLGILALAGMALSLLKSGNTDSSSDHVSPK